MYVNAIANIKTGSLIAENYGPLYSQDPIEERKKLLKKQYWFDCNCVACQHNWPEYNRFKTNELRFKYLIYTIVSQHRLIQLNHIICYIDATVTDPVRMFW